MERRPDVVVIGAGRVGLPLALLLEDKGLVVDVKDRRQEICDALREQKMPFHEPGFDELIARTRIVPHKDTLPDADAYIITVGTPLRQHIETDLRQIKAVLQELIQSVDLHGKLLILRSTVAPHTSEYVRDFIETKQHLVLGRDFYLAMCPERIVEGKALVELGQLPQIVGVQESESFVRAKNIFLRLLPQEKIIKTSFLEAELSKLFTNIYRYVNFAIPNYFAMLAHSFHVDIFHLMDVMNYGYERNNGMRLPGLTAGTCLRKDFGMINEYLAQTDLLLQAYKINEFMPKFVADLVRDELQGRRVGILGYTFKANTDDVRDTLVAKLIRYIERSTQSEIMISDYHLPSGRYIDSHNERDFVNWSTDKVIQESEVIFIATNHEQYYSLKNRDLLRKIIVDPWRVLGLHLVNRF